MCFENNTDVQCQISPLLAVSLFQTVNLASRAGYVLSQNLAPATQEKQVSGLLFVFFFSTEFTSLESLKGKWS